MVSRLLHNIHSAYVYSFANINFYSMFIMKLICESLVNQFLEEGHQSLIQITTIFSSISDYITKKILWHWNILCTKIVKFRYKILKFSQ